MPEQVPIAAGVVQQRLDARLLLDEHGQRQRAQPRAGALAVRNVDDVDAVALQLAGALDRRLRLEAARRQQLDATTNASARELAGQARLLLARHRRSR